MIEYRNSYQKSPAPFRSPLSTPSVSGWPASGTWTVRHQPSRCDPCARNWWAIRSSTGQSSDDDDGGVVARHCSGRTGGDGVGRNSRRTIAAVSHSSLQSSSLRGTYTRLHGTMKVVKTQGISHFHCYGVIIRIRRR